MGSRIVKLLAAAFAVSCIAGGANGLTCYMCNSMMGDQNRTACPNNADSHPMSCGDYRFCMKLNGTYNTYNATNNYNITSVGEHRDCGSQGKLDLFLYNVGTMETKCYDVDFGNSSRVVPSQYGTTYAHFSGKVCLCYGDNCNPASRVTASFFGLSVVLLSASRVW